MKARRHSPAVSAGIACSLAIAGAWLSFAPARADDTAASMGTPGTWQSHKYSFQFMGFTSTYSCDGLADKLKTLLLAAGARADAKSRPGACASGFGRPDKFARADLTFSTLSPAPGDAASDAKPVNGVWRTVTFTSRKAPIPITVLSSAPYPVTVVLSLSSDKFEFPQGATQTLHLDRPTTPVRVQAKARTSGDNLPVEVTLRTPDGQLVIARSLLSVHSTSISIVGIALTALAGLVLLIWWGRTWRRGRRHRPRAH